MDLNIAVIKCVSCGQNIASEDNADSDKYLCEECLANNRQSNHSKLDDVSNVSTSPKYFETVEPIYFEEFSNVAPNTGELRENNHPFNEHFLEISTNFYEKEESCIPLKKVRLSETSMKEDKLYESALINFIAKDPNCVKLRKEAISCCVIGNVLFAMESANRLIDIYERRSLSFRSVIDCEQFIPKDSILPRTFFRNPIVAVGQHLFLLGDDFDGTKVYKYDFETDDFVRWGTMGICCLSSTIRGTLIARTIDEEIIEYSVDLEEIGRIKIPDEANLKRQDGRLLYVPCFYVPPVQLNDGRCVVASYNSLSFLISLLDADGKIIASYSKSSECNIRTCTNGKDHVFVLEKPSGHIMVLSVNNKLQQISFFDIIGAENISYDQENNRIMIITSTNIFFHYVSNRPQAKLF